MLITLTDPTALGAARVGARGLAVSSSRPAAALFGARGASASGAVHRGPVQGVPGTLDGHGHVALSRRLHKASRVLVDTRERHAGEEIRSWAPCWITCGDALVNLAPELGEVTKGPGVGDICSGLNGAGDLLDATRGEGCFAGGGAAVADHPADVVGRVDEAKVRRRAPDPLGR